MPYVTQTYTSISISKRNLNKLNRISSWIYSRLLGTFLQKRMMQFLGDSILTQYSLALFLGLFIGFFVDYSLGIITQYSYPIYSYMLLSAIVCYIVFGGGGIPIGFIWGWVVGGIIDTVSNELLNDKIIILSKFITWLVVCIISWYIGSIAEWLFDKIIWKYIFIKGIIITISIVIVLSSSAILCYKLFLIILPLLQPYLLHYPIKVLLVISCSITMIISWRLFSTWRKYLQEKEMKETIINSDYFKKYCYYYPGDDRINSYYKKSKILFIFFIISVILLVFFLLALFFNF